MKAAPWAVWFAVLVALLPMTLAAVPTTASEPPLLPQRPWLQIETDGFTLLGDVSEEQLVSLAHRLECSRRFFLSMAKVQRQALEGTAPTFVYAFAERETFPVRGGKLFAPREHRNYAVVHVEDQDPISRDTSQRVLGREYVYQVLHVTRVPYPLWFREGLAELLTAVSIPSDSCDEVILGGVPSIGILLEKRLWPVDRVLATTEMPELESSDSFRFRFTSWALLHYLMLGNPETAKQLPELVRRTRAGESSEEAFANTFDAVLPEDLQTTLAAYVEGGRRPRLRLALGNAPELRVETRTLGRAEVLFRLGDLWLETGPVVQDPELERAASFLQQAVALDPDQGSAHLGLARLAHQKGETDAVLEHAERALEHLPAEATAERVRAHVLKGSAILDSLNRRRARSEADRARLAQAREALHRATELAPADPHPWSELVVAYGLEPRPVPEELEVVAEAMERFPDRLDLVSNALLAHGRRGDTETAEALYRRLEEMGAEAATLTRGREVLLRLAFFQADRWIHEERHEDAIGLFGRIQTQTTDDRLRQQVTDRIALLERAEEYNRFIGRLLECQERMANGDFVGAQELIETLRETAHPGKQTEVVEDLAGYLATLRAEAESARSTTSSP